MSAYRKFRCRVWQIVDLAQAGDTASRVFDVAILSLIFLNVVAVIIDTVKSVHDAYGYWFNVFEIFSVIVFTIEYLLRLWSCVDRAGPEKRRSRLLFIFQPMPIIDLVAILPFYLPIFGLDLRVVRVFRLVRILRIAKMGRYVKSLTLIKNVLRDKKEELIMTTSLMFFILIVSASVIYYCEKDVQPEQFSSIPATLWWSVITLTTVGYGDIYPITVMGKICAGVVAVLGIGMFALPTGIIGSGFVEEIQKHREGKKCPHCGKDID